MLELTRPNCVNDQEWEALAKLRDRLGRADRDNDAELMLGTAKELCESVAKIAHQQRSEPFAPLPDMPELINGAHRLVDRIPAEGGAQRVAVRGLAQTAMKLAKQLNDLRNQAGTGHGRPDPTGLDEIDGRFAAATGLLWSSWVLSRLDALVAADPDRLAADIASQIFYAGDLERRLREAGLATMEPRDQHAVGYAVGQRGGPGGTANVYREGVAPARSDPDLTRWPAEYRRGVALGLITDRNGYTVVSRPKIISIVELLGPLPDGGATVIDELRGRIAESELAYSVSEEELAEAIDTLREGAFTSGPPLAAALESVALELAGRQ